MEVNSSTLPPWSATGLKTTAPRATPTTPMITMATSPARNTLNPALVMRMMDR